MYSEFCIVNVTYIAMLPLISVAISYNDNNYIIVFYIAI
jgi:hypothetical protein